MTRVAIIRPPRALEGYSMARYADRIRRHASGYGITIDQNVLQLDVALKLVMRLSPRLGRFLQRELFWPMAARRVAATVAADVIHIPDHSYASSVRYFPGKLTVVTCHDVIPLETGMLKNVLETRLYLANICALREAGRVIADSQATHRGLVRHGLTGQEAVAVIPLGVDGEFFARPAGEARMQTRSRLGLGDTGTLILHVSNLAPYKNLNGILTTFAMYRREHDQDARLALAGPMDHRVRRSILSAGLERAVIVVPPLSDPELAALYRSADVLLFPSLFEGFGLPVLEAMAAGLPVVVSDRGSLPELVADGTPCFEPDDHRGMCDQVDRTMRDDPYRRTLIADGVHKAGSFTWERCGAATAAVYAGLVG